MNKDKFSLVGAGDYRAGSLIGKEVELLAIVVLILFGVVISLF